jgi:hypothetical protein
MRRFAFVTVLALTLCASPARAQVPPPPEQAAPVFELVAPTVSPACGNAVLVVALAPGIVAGPTGGAVPIELLTPAFGPVFVLCGSVPAPPARLSCDADHSVNSTANAIIAAVAGTPLPVGVDPFGNAVEQVIVVQDKLPPPASTTGALDQVVATLNCKAAASPTVQPEPSSEPAPSEDTGLDESVLGDELALAPLLDTLTPDVTTSPEPAPSRVVPTAPAGQVGGAVGFAYPVVFALPLLLLVLGGYLGRSLTQPVGAPQRRTGGLVAGTTHDGSPVAKVEP